MGLFNLFKKKETPPVDKIETPTQAHAQAPTNIKIEAKTECVPVATTSTSKKTVLSYLSLSGYKSLSGGYMSYTEFLVSGHILNEKTGRKNLYKETICAQTKDEVIEKIKDVPFVDDYKIEVVPFEAPTEKQLNYAADLGAVVPDDATKWDVSAIIGRYTGALGDVAYDEPQESPSEEFASFACNMGIRFSRFIGEDDLFNSVVNTLEGRDKAAFYAYCILKSTSATNGTSVSAAPEYPDLTEPYKFADSVASSESIMKSINERTPDDYRSPHKGTKAYKAVAEYFRI